MSPEKVISEDELDILRSEGEGMPAPQSNQNEEDIELIEILKDELNSGTPG